jgi:hypothetical protein
LITYWRTFASFLQNWFYMRHLWKD